MAQNLPSQIQMTTTSSEAVEALGHIFAQRDPGELERRGKDSESFDRRQSAAKSADVMAGASIPRWKRYAEKYPERKKASADRYRAANREKRNACKREWAKRNKEHVRKYQEQWTAKQPPLYWFRWQSRPPQRTRKPGRTYEQTLEAHKEARKLDRQKIGDSYLRGWMSRTTGYTIKPSEWPADLVELKRAQLKTIRLCRKSRTTTN
jgi:hypothetical protein